MPSDINTFIAACAAFISLTALGLAIWQARATAKHNKLSVTPRLRFDIWIEEDISRVALGIKNYGIGPSIITDYHVYLDDREIENFNQDPDEAVKALFSDLECNYYWLKGKEDALESNGEIILFDITDIPLKFFRNTEQIVHNRLSIAINYHSVYNEEDIAYYNRELA